MDNGWFAYQSTTGEILFFFNKFTQEYRWLSCACTQRCNKILSQDVKQEVKGSPPTCSSVRNIGTETDPLLSSTTKEFKTQGTQTDIRNFESVNVHLEEVNSLKSKTVNHVPNSLNPHIKQEPGLSNATGKGVNQIGNKVRLYPCPYCSKAFTSYIFLKKHVKCHETEAFSQVSIDCSPKGIDRVDILEKSKHSPALKDSSDKGLQVEVDTKQCFQCNQNFSSSDALDEHFTLHYDDLYCKGCNKTFGCTKSFRAHLDVHFGETHHCQCCSKKFALKIGLLRHIRYAHSSIWNDDSKRKLLQLESQLDTSEESGSTSSMLSNVPFKCDECSFSCSLYSQLVRHQSTCKKPKQNNDARNEITPPAHSKKRHWCSKCDLYFSSLKTLSCHRLKSNIHKLNTSHGPEVQRSLRKTVPQAHVKYNNKLFYCLDCSSSFDDYQSLKQHRSSRVCSNSFKLENNNYQCLFCPEICASRIDQSRHMNAHITLNDDGVYSCFYCTKQFKDKNMMERHIYYHLSMVSCSICSMKFQKLRELQRHSKKVHGKSSHPFTCTVCNKKFKTSGSLTNHNIVHKGKAGACKFCGKAFAYVKNLSSHMKKCTRKNLSTVVRPKEEDAIQVQSIESNFTNRVSSFDTDQQEMNNSNSEGLEQNVVMNATIKSEVCEEVPFSQDKDQISSQKSEISSPINCPNLRARKFFKYYPENQQMNYVQKENKFQCTSCRKFFSSRYSLIRHQDLKRHGDRCCQGLAKRFKCPLCKKSFHSYSMYYQHQHKHQRQTKSQCKKCGTLFSSSKMLSFHKCSGTSTNSSPEYNNNVYQCEMCQEVFSSGVGLSNHMRGHKYEIKPKGTGTWECKICKMVFENEKKLRRHKKTEVHSNNISKKKNFGGIDKKRHHECSECGKFFKTRKILLKHRKRYCKAATLIQCPNCKKVFPSYKVFEEHHHSAHDDNGKPCWLCCKSFSNYNNLNRHVKDIHKDSKKLICYCCSKEFHDISSFSSHITRFNNKGEKHPCIYCGGSFSCCSKLVEHMRSCH